MLSVEIEDRRGLYKAVRSGVPSRIGMRENLSDLGFSLARQTRVIVMAQLPAPQRVLCVVILRGGGMLYPGFLSEFVEADFCMLGLQRGDGGQGEAKCTYCSPLESSHYDSIIFLDCISATGGTILEASRFLQTRCDTEARLAAVICSSAVGSRALNDSGIGVIGFSLRENMKGNVVTPDFGEMDAGDIFFRAQVSPTLDLATAAQ
ncbi:uracil phosphoribosyltransferase [Rhizobium sp. VS19-DR104.2]|uniref:uracil phosphoribosyltransferase n=2 Tax=Rhizobium TaxID=379 RepID=UPI001C5B3637|nr:MULTISPECIES: uracil phosphoribosyltransferase [unclassified Rhizobium]MBZ5762106.1 uracil phosphoribosyltransferase [Rhizobium sp. VS19-DR96]MBZ5768219.1 uracil phosphoribosyltransferase [Rhizobium sp. VS19-DR129.2]MBZ5775716.1 uracil phosphoribosyltransferase [Rhizobium sp. VS19-DRK62.2]MBZ5786983.1 uracil phosphoribosyltransferase [Rhizobium sp. VS19-DR121]MBZ5804144.1 uracil phosphoribosyltransferase [Rhizobium sp. VS19-DR181]